MADNTTETKTMHGTFCWNELITTDTGTCKEFFTNLLGWTAEEQNMGGTDYTVFKYGEKMTAGMMKTTPEMGDVPPHWLSYIAVDQPVDELVPKIEKMGGKILVPPMDVPTVGRFIVLADPTGAVVSLITLEQK
jgi:predicted enzyme related to lactoylglutathione lyase